MKTITYRTNLIAATCLITLGGFVSQTAAVPVAVTNAGFEDVIGLDVFNEFNFGMPVGWTPYDPSNLIPDPDVYVGMLQPNGTVFFNDFAPEGAKVGILFNSEREGEGEYGYEQTLTGTPLLANTDYVLTVEVGNIASGIATNGTPFDLSGFPGYRIELLAGGVMIAEDNNSLTIAEGEFETSIISFNVGAGHTQLGQDLGIRLINLNVIPDGFIQATSPDLEVDFDDITLSAAAIPEPSSALLISAAAAGLTITRRRQPQMRP